MAARCGRQGWGERILALLAGVHVSSPSSFLGGIIYPAAME